MSVLKRVEDLLERKIDGFFNKRLKSKLRVEEIAARIQRSIDEGKAEEDNVVYAPNRFMIYINEEDYLKLQPELDELTGDLTQFALAAIKQRGYASAGDVRIHVFCGETEEDELLKVVADFDNPQNYSISDESFATQTAVFDKVSEEISLYNEQKCNARLYCSCGVEEGQSLVIGTGRINIGRWDNSDFRVNDNTVSRLHAYILFINGEHVIHDADSSNGTYVNSRRIAYKVLKDGDEIKVGSTVLIYNINS